jgi:hypothetical protein
MYFTSRSDLSASTSSESRTVASKERTSTPDSNRIPFSYYTTIGKNKNDEEKKDKGKFRSHEGLILTACCCCIWTAAVLAVIFLLTISIIGMY